MDWLQPHSKREEGHNLGNPSFNTAGVVYATFITAYTGFVIYALCMLWRHRHHTAVRIRGFYITAVAVLSIHVYVAALFIVYPLNGWYKCSSEFWYMSIIFPLGVAMYQASNIRLMSYSKTQHDLVDLKFWAEKKKSFTWTVGGVKCWIRHQDLVMRTYIGIAAGILLQIIMTFVLFYGSRRFQPNSGFFGDHVDQASCRRGGEWIPSVVWQFLWVWGFGPYVLYKTRHIKDCHHWAFQTRLAIIVGLPGAPMWLAFLYAGANNPSINLFNTWWPPAMWFGPGLITMQLSSIIAPFWDIWGHTRPTSYSKGCDVSSLITDRSAVTGRKSKDYANNFELFEQHLHHRIESLFWFAATKDFTAENIQFLREVRNFKRTWRHHLACPPAGGLVLTPTEQRSMFEDAARIYFELVCPTTSRCSINVESKIYQDLEAMFKTLNYEPPANYDGIGLSNTNIRTRRASEKTAGPSLESTRSRGRVEAVAPWHSPSASAISLPATGFSRTDSDSSLTDIGTLEALTPAATTTSASASSTAEDPFTSVPRVPSRIPLITTTITAPVTRPPSAFFPICDRGRITTVTSDIFPTTASSVPSTFSLRVFDRAEHSIKYLVYTNTWKSYVAESDVAQIESSTSMSTFVNGRHEDGARGDYGTEFDRSGAFANIELGSLQQIENHHNSARRNIGIGPSFLYHGVLDGPASNSPIPIEHVDSRCMTCRRKEPLGRHDEVMKQKQENNQTTKLKFGGKWCVDHKDKGAGVCIEDV